MIYKYKLEYDTTANPKQSRMDTIYLFTLLTIV